MTNEELLHLLEKFEAGQCTTAEMEMLNQWFEEVVPGEEQYALNPADKEKLTEAKLSELRQLLKKRKPAIVKLYRRPYWRVAIAVAAMLILAIGIYWKFTFNKNNALSKTSVVQSADIAPGHDGAILTLAGGKQVVLDSAGSGTIALQGNVQVVNNTGQLSYKEDHTSASVATLTYNTLSTPNGRQYKLVLPDGTKVWLNAASSIRYPTAFTGNERKVEITGEAWFDVVHNAAKPFRVIAKGVTINDIGTQFDISAYNDEPLIKATLLQGAIKVNSASGGRLLKPGQQAQVNDKQQIKVVQLPDVEDAIAWKNGLINFDDVALPVLMRQIARWYNVDIVYNGTPPNFHISGNIPRNTNLSVVLKALALNKVRCRLEGRSIIVLP